MSNTFTQLRYHLVFGTKQRMPTVNAEIKEDLYRYIGGIIRQRQGTLIEIGGVADHVHILAGSVARHSLSEMLQHIKGGSSSWLNAQPLCSEPFAWQKGYAGFTVSESQVPKVRRYIQCQEEHHRIQSFKDEILMLLDRHGVECDGLRPEGARM